MILRVDKYATMTEAEGAKVNRKTFSPFRILYKDNKFIGLIVYVDDDKEVCRRIFLPKDKILKIKWLLEKIITDKFLDTSNLPEDFLIKYQDVRYDQTIENNNKIQDVYVNNKFVRRDNYKHDYEIL